MIHKTLAQKKDSIYDSGVIFRPRHFSTMNSIPNQVLVSFGALALAASTLGYTSPAQALTFDFQFDNVGDGLPLDPPIASAGVFSFDGNPGTGTFALDSLANFNFFFDFGDEITFNNADIATPTSEVLVVITTVGSSFSLNFSNTGSESGLFSGSIDFVNIYGDVLSFEPPSFNGNLDLYVVDSVLGNYVGNYQATTVPEPLTMLGASAAITFGAAFKRRKSQ